jgi:hypothetical protein
MVGNKKALKQRCKKMVSKTAEIKVEVDRNKLWANQDMAEARDPKGVAHLKSDVADVAERIKYNNKG